MLRDVRYQAAVALSFGSGWQNLGVRSALVPVILVASLGAQPAFVGVAFAIAAVVQTLALVPIGRATDLIGRREVMVASGLLSGLAALAIPFTHDVWLLVGVLCLAGIAAAGLGTAPTAAVGDAAHGAGTKPLAWYSMSGDVGALLGPLAAEPLANRFGMEWAFAAGSALLLLGALWSIRMPARRA